ncbi:hypothetical protein QBC40DRAFT_319890 [Triangularia verruculosa]|uniref:Uncharacterized protein n=1 Tax=Triangularia verruculosa TaxID=2587418 RepID=A0AAN6X7N4_9PEZI|nr:hypothetical protein QBC40DRAFT_319890 [Triangularia verruculosa]
MISIPTFLAGLLALTSVTYARPADDPSSDDGGVDTAGIAGYGTATISWDLPIDLNNLSGDTLTVTGSVQEAVAAMEAAYPGWNATFQSKLPAPSPDDDDDGSSLQSRNGLLFKTPTVDHRDCDINYVKADIRRINDGIRYLRGLSGTAKNGPGWGNCGRVSCSWTAAIWWCNDNAEEKEVQWGDIADGAEYLTNKCQQPRRKVRGQVFYTDNWNVIVRMDQNNC